MPRSSRPPSGPVTSSARSCSQFLDVRVWKEACPGEEGRARARGGRRLSQRCRLFPVFIRYGAHEVEDRGAFVFIIKCTLPVAPPP